MFAMPFRFYFLFVSFFLFWFFYPGETPYTTILSHYHDKFTASEVAVAPIRVPPFPVLLQTPADVTAEGVYVVEQNTFTPVMLRNVTQTFYPASTTKIITALVAYDLYKTDDIVTIQPPLVSEGQLMGLVPGERITIENLLYGALVHSGNDAAGVLASFYGYDKFIEKMNEKAATLGMSQSHFKNPTGLDEGAQLTTPRDLTIAARALLQNTYLRKIVSTKEITISDVDFTTFHRLENVNKLLGEIAGVGGLKTGFTEAAGENLVSYFRHGGHDYILVVMKSKDRFEDTKRILTFISQNARFVTP